MNDLPFRHDIKSRIRWGGAWSMAILVLSVLLAAGGHGTFVLLGLFSAPASLLGTKIAWYSCIPVGIALAVLAPRRGFPIVVSVHYLTGLAVTTLTDFDNWRRLSTLPSQFALTLSAGVGLYAIGHYLLWRTWMDAQRDRRAS
jgi:hypothetical protein